MGNLNKVMLIGRLVRDPELRYTPSGVAWCSVTVAISRPYKSPENGQKSDFLDVSIWRNQAENCAQYLKKGREVFVEGMLQKRSWEKDGQKRVKLQIVASRVQFLGKKSDLVNGENELQQHDSEPEESDGMDSKTLQEA